MDKREFLNAVNRGNYNAVSELIRETPIELIQSLQDNFKFFNGTLELILLNNNKEYFDILTLLIASGLKVSLRNMKILVDIFSRDVKKLGTIFLLYSSEDQAWYIEELIKTYGIGEYLLTLAKMLGNISNIRLHIIFTEFLLDLVDIYLEGNDQEGDKTLLERALILEEGNFQMLGVNIDTMEARNLITKTLRILRLH